MKDKNSRKKPKRRRGTSFQVREVTIISNPGPDAKDRLRGLMTLMIKHATRDGYLTPGEDAPADDRPADDTTEAEA